MEIIAVMHSCGHEEEHPYTGRAANLVKWQKKTSEEPCTDCCIKDLNEKSLEYKLPLLEGSPSQVKWALEIRLGLYQEYLQLFGMMKKGTAKEERQKLIETIVKAFDLLHTKEAKFFIEHKSMTELLEYHKIITLKKNSLGISLEGDLFESADEDVFKDNEEYRFD